MSNPVSMNNSSEYKACVFTGATSGIGRATTLEVIKHGKVVLVGRDREKLNPLQKEVERKDGHAVSVVCDLSDLASVRRAAAEIIALDLPIVGLLNNAGIFPMRATKNALGCDNAFATNHIGPFVLTEALISCPTTRASSSSLRAWKIQSASLRRWRASAGAGTSPQRRAHAASASRAASKMPGADAYAKSKQWTLATTLEFARETPRLRFNAVEPGFSPATGLGRDANVFLRFLGKYVLSMLAPHIKYWSTPKSAARVITKALLNESGETGIYYEEGGRPMLGSALVRDPKFQDPVVAETRALLSTIPGQYGVDQQLAIVTGPLSRFRAERRTP